MAKDSTTLFFWRTLSFWYATSKMTCLGFGEIEVPKPSTLVILNFSKIAAANFFTYFRWKKFEVLRHCGNFCHETSFSVCFQNTEH